MARIGAALVLVVVAAGCGSDGGGGDGQPSRAPVLAESGCFACHRVGSEGTKDPGGDLTRIGARLSAKEIEQALVDPPSGMPSYSSLPKDELDALVDDLSQRR